MLKIISINFITAIFYSFVMFILFKTGYVNAKGLTYSNLKYLLIFPFTLITVSFNSVFIFKYKHENKKVQYFVQVVAAILMILLMSQFICAPIIFVTFTLGLQILFHSIDVVLFIILITFYILDKKKLLKSKN